MARRIDQYIGKENILDRILGIHFSVRAELVVIIGLAVLALLFQGINMFHYPTLGRLDDEGIYMSQAWSVLREARLSPYTYFYDHAPGGWILIAIWMGLVGGPHTFGTAIDTGRVFMLLLHLANVLMLYFLARKMNLSIPMSGLAAIIMAISPIAITYQRMVLLDNPMTFWILVSLNLLIDKFGRMSSLVLSGLAYGIAILTKETAIFLLPAMLYLAYEQRKVNNEGKWTVPEWFIAIAVVVALYPLYALFKGQLMPITILGNHLDSQSGVYLIDTLKWQGSRGGGSAFNPGSMFWQQVRTNWVPVAPFLTIGGIVAVIANLLLGLRNPKVLEVGFLGLFPMIYLAHGGIVYDFYILFAIPFLCLNIALLLGQFFNEYIPKPIRGPLAGVIGLLLLALYVFSGQMRLLYQSGPDTPYRQALAWIQSNVNPASHMIIPDNIWVDLHEPGKDKIPFTNAHSYWKAGADPVVRDQIFQNNWQNVDYVVLFPTTRQDLQSSNNTLTLSALNNASMQQHWVYSDQFVELWNINNGKTKGGNGTTASSQDQKLLQSSYSYIKTTLSKDGTYTNSDGSITSGNQTDAMLRAVWMNDKEEYYRVWGWTQKNLMNPEGLLAWQWKNRSISDVHSASDADTDAALALLFAGRRWNDPQLINAGTQMVHAIRKTEVFNINGNLYMAAGDWAMTVYPVPVIPGYFSPYAYRVFNEVDPNDGWWNLVLSGYSMVSNASTLSLHGETPVGLPPDWIGIDRNSGNLTAISLPTIKDTTLYGYNASRTYWRIALDQLYSKDTNAQNYLSQANFLKDQVNSQGYPSAVYTHDGKVVQQDPNTVGLAGALGILMFQDQNAAARLYSTQIARTANQQSGGLTWNDPHDLFAQEWAFYAIGLYTNQLPDLWWYIPPGG